MTPNEIADIQPYGFRVSHDADELIRAWQIDSASLSSADLKYVLDEHVSWYRHHIWLASQHQDHAFQNLRALSNLDLSHFTKYLLSHEEVIVMAEYDGSGQLIDYPVIETFSDKHIGMMRNDLTRRFPNRLMFLWEDVLKFDTEFWEWCLDNLAAGWMRGHFPSAIWPGPCLERRNCIASTSVIIFDNLVDGYSFRARWE